MTSLLKESVRQRRQVVVEKIAIACRLQLFVSLCGGIIKHDTELKRKVKRWGGELESGSGDA